MISPDSPLSQVAELDAAAGVEQRALRADAARNRERLLEAAARVFDEQGLEASVADVARAAGVGMGTLYRRFPSKEALVDALVAEVLTATMTMANEAAEQPDGKGLERFLARWSAHRAEHVGSLPRLFNTKHELVDPTRRLVADLLADAKRHGRVRSDLTITDVNLAMFSIGGVLQTTRGASSRAWQRLLDLVIAGMRPGADKLPHRPITQAEMDKILSISYEPQDLRGAS